VKNAIPKYNCEICLWSFEIESESTTHDYLEHMIIKRQDARNREHRYAATAK